MEEEEQRREDTLGCVNVEQWQGADETVASTHSKETHSQEEPSLEFPLESYPHCVSASPPDFCPGGSDVEPKTERRRGVIPNVDD